MKDVYLALGSNMGDRRANLQAAVAAFEPDVTPIACSPVYETPPWGYLDQPRFLNQVIKTETNLTPSQLLDYLKELERGQGRQDTFRYGPRTIDLDIIFYGQEVVDTAPLRIPHPRLEERAFVLVPLADLAPQFQHPILGQSILELLEKVDREGIVFHSPEGCQEQPA